MGDNDGSSGSFRQVEDWLRSLGLICYAQSFYDNGYENVDICRQIQEQDLVAIGITNVKDKSDILAGVCRLKQKAVYFELEPEQEQSEEVIRRKYDPFLLITRVKAELENSNTQLTEPPYFYPDGSLGSLDSLAETLSYSMETFVEDVLGALDQLRRRQLPAGLYNDVHEMMELQRQQEVKKQFNPKLIGPPKPKRESMEEPKAYLNVETPFRRTTSLSKNDHRITKSTTNLTDIDFAEEKLLVSGAHKKGKKSKAVMKSYSTRDKSKNLFGLSIRKRSTTAENKTNINRESFVAKDLTLNQQELIDLMTQVKHGEISQENATARATLNYRQSILGPQAGFSKVEKHQLTKKEKKKLDKEEKKRKKERGKVTGQSLFYCPEINDNEPGVIPLDGRQVDDVISLGNSSGSDISRESPDLRSFGEGKMKATLSNGVALNTSEDSMNSSTGSLNSSQCATPNTAESRIKSRSNSVRSVTKPAKQPPPIPVRTDHTADHTNSDNNVDQLFAGNSLVSFANKKPLKSVLSAPLSEGTINSNLVRPELSASKSQEFAGRVYDKNTEKDNALITNTAQLAQTALEEIKQKSLERKQRLTMSSTEKDELCKDKSTAIRNAPIPPERTDKSVVLKAPSVAAPSVSPFQRDEIGGSDKAESRNEDKMKTEEISKNLEKQRPAPPPRKIERDVEKKPVIPPRKRRSVLNDVKDENLGDAVINKEKAVSDNPVQSTFKPAAKPKPSLPPRSVPSSSATDVGKDAKGTELVLGVSNKVSKRDDIQPPDSNVHLVKAGINMKKLNSTFTPRSIKQLIEMKCNQEHVDLSEYPYSDQDGSWSVPYLLTRRYAEELELPIARVVEAMDTLRSEKIEKAGKVAKRPIVTDVIQNTKCDAVMTTLKDWLISRGLPMFIKDFSECGLVSLEHLHSLKRKDILLAGVFETKHVDRLLAYLQ